MDKSNISNICINQCKLISSLTGRGQKRGDSRRVPSRLISEMEAEWPDGTIILERQSGFKTLYSFHDSAIEYSGSSERYGVEASEMPIHGYRLDDSNAIKSNHSFVNGSSTSCNNKSIFGDSYSADQISMQLFSSEGGV